LPVVLDALPAELCRPGVEKKKKTRPGSVVEGLDCSLLAMTIVAHFLCKPAAGRQLIDITLSAAMYFS